LPSRSPGERVGGEVESIVPGERVGDHEGWGGQVVLLMSGLIRPSKFRLPDRTETTARIVLVDGGGDRGGSGPEFPMHVVQP
jgi:hypothetical protein